MGVILLHPCCVPRLRLVPSLPRTLQGGGSCRIGFVGASRCFVWGVVDIVAKCAIGGVDGCLALLCCPFADLGVFVCGVGLAVALRVVVVKPRGTVATFPRWSCTLVCASVWCVSARSFCVRISHSVPAAVAASGVLAHGATRGGAAVGCAAACWAGAVVGSVASAAATPLQWVAVASGAVIHLGFHSGPRPQLTTPVGQ